MLSPSAQSISPMSRVTLYLVAVAAYLMFRLTLVETLVLVGFAAVLSFTEKEAG